MPQRTVPFVNGQIYHIYNRGVEKRRIFEDKNDYKRFVLSLTYYELKGPKPKLSNSFRYRQSLTNNTKIIEVLAYCLMPNHFHLLVKQLEEGGITDTLTKLGLSYTKFYNLKYKRVGPLFQGEFKAVLVETDEQLIHLSRYIHLNPIASFLIKNLADYKWSSYLEYVNDIENICFKDDVLSFFKTPDEYKQFIDDQINYGQTLELIKHQIIEDS